MRSGGISDEGLRRLAKAILAGWEEFEEKAQEITNDPEADYTVRESAPGEYEVAKWGLGNEPESVYSVIYEESPGVGPHWACDCPAYTRGVRNEETDKHIQMAKAWLEEESPLPFELVARKNRG